MVQLNYLDLLYKLFSYPFECINTVDSFRGNHTSIKALVIKLCLVINFLLNIFTPPITMEVMKWMDMTELAEGCYIISRGWEREREREQWLPTSTRRSITCGCCQFALGLWIFCSGAKAVAPASVAWETTSGTPLLLPDTVTKTTLAIWPVHHPPRHSS